MSRPDGTISRLLPGARSSLVQAVVALLVLGVMYSCGSDAAGPNGVASVVVTPEAGDVRAGATMFFAVTLRNATGALLIGRTVTWRSANPLIAEVSTSGVVTGHATGTTRITATAEGVEGGAQIVVLPGPAVGLTFTVPATTTVVGSGIDPPVRVAAHDAMGNVATDFAGNVTLALTTNPAGGILSGPTTVAAVAGVATFAGLSLDQIGDGYVLGATALGLTGAATPAFSITPGPAARLEFTVAPHDTIAGAVLTPAIQVTARDAMGNVATAFTGPVTASLGTNPAGGTLRGTTTVGAVAGVARFATLSVDRIGSGYTLNAAAAGLPDATSEPFAITVGPATRLAFTVQPGTGTAGAALTPAVQVAVHDAGGNTAATFTGPVTVALGANPGGATLSGTTTVSAVDGVATFATLSLDRTGSGYTLTAAAAGLSGAASTQFNVDPGPATLLAFTVQPGTATAGATLTPTVQVTARDVLGNTATAFSGPITVALGSHPAGAALSGPATVSAVGGVATFAGLSVNVSGGGYTLTAAATGLTGATSAAFSVIPGAATELTFTVQPGTDTAGAVLTPAVQVVALDDQGNVATAFTGLVTVTIGVNPGGSTLSGLTTVAAIEGVARFATLSLDRSGAGYTLTAAAPNLTGAASTAFTVTPAAATTLAFTVQPPSDTAGAVLSPAVEVTARDAHGNVATAFTGLVTVAIGSNPGGGTLSGTTTVGAVAGVASFATLSINRSGTGYTLTAMAAGLGGVTSGTFAIHPGAAVELAFTVQPAGDTAGGVLTPAVQVTARDAHGNTATGFTGVISVAIGSNPGGGTLSGATDVSAVAGVATFAGLSINRTGIGYALTAAAGGLAGATSAAFSITPGTATQLAFTGQPAADTAGGVITPAVQVTAQDAFGNTATAFTGSITVALGANPGGGTLSGTTTVSAVGGVVSFATLSIDAAGSGYTLTAAATGLSGATSAAFTIGAADGEAPTAPTNLTATPVAATQIDLAWTAATDNVGVTGYRVYRDGLEVGTSTTTSYADVGLGAATSHTYQVAAFDAAANVSGLSNSASATTLALNASCPLATVHCVDDDAGVQQEYATLQAAADVVNPGDTILVFAGNYVGVELWRDGTAGHRIVLLAAESGVVINTGGIPEGDGVRFTDVNYITVDGFTIQNPPGRCVSARGASATAPMTGNQVRNITCSGAGLEGFYLSEFANAVVENNTIAGSGQVIPDRAHGIYLANAGSDNTVLRGNRIYNHTGLDAQGIHLNGDASIGGDGLITGVLVEGNVVYGNGTNGFSLDGVQSSTFQNNLLYGNGRNALRGFAIDGAAGPQDLTIINNTFIVPAAGGWAIKLTEDGGGHTIFNNILVGFTGSICVAHANVASDNNAGLTAFSTDGDNSIITLAQWQAAGHDVSGVVATAAALFVNPGAADYHLAAGGPAIDAGRPNLNGKNAPLVDLDRRTRPRGATHDIGAYEF